MEQALWKAVEGLVRRHFELEPDLDEIYVFVDTESGDVPRVHLLEVNAATIPTEEPETFSFGPTDEHPFVTSITEITPEEFQRWDEDDTYWSIEEARRFERPEAA